MDEAVFEAYLVNDVYKPRMHKYAMIGCLCEHDAAVWETDG